MKNQEKSKARELRSQGVAIKKIAEELSVSASSVSLWVRDIELTSDQIIALQNANPIYNAQNSGAKARKENAYQVRLTYQETGKLKAKEGDLLHQAGCMLYWGEGDKDRNVCGLSNCDPDLLRMFLRFLLEACEVNKEHIKVHVHCYTNNGLSVDDIENFWSKELDLPLTTFTKTTANSVSKSSLLKKAPNKQIYGTVSIRVCDTQLVQGIYGAIQEYAGFNNKYCVD